MLEIQSPLSASREVAPLIAAGADGFYAGVVPGSGSERQVPAYSRRAEPENNFVDRDDLLEALELLEQGEKQLQLAFNEHFYTRSARRAVLEMVDEIAAHPAMGGVILADVGLCLEFRERFPDLPCTASTGLALQNGSAVRFAAALGLKRVVLPRSLRLDEMAQIAAECPDMELEAFVLNDRCPNIDGLCHFVHCEIDGRGFGNLCKQVALSRVYLGGHRVAVDGGEYKSRFAEACQFEKDACGVCFLGRLAEIGVAHAKIVGRDRSLEEKLRDLRFAVAARDHWRSGPASQSAFREAVQRIRVEHYGEACRPTQCYYQW